MDSNELNNESPFPIQRGTAHEGSMDHILEILASHSHPLILVGCSAQRWMGSAGTMTSSCDLIVRDSALESIASKIVETGNWEFHNPGPHIPGKPIPSVECDADRVLRRTEIKHGSEYQYLNLWSEIVYRINVDTCPVVEVPDVYPWHHVLVEAKWHPAIEREDEWWFGPRLCPDTKLPNLPERATLNTIFSKGLPRGKGASNKCSVLVPSLPVYLDALIYQVTHYKQSKPGLASIASWQIRNLTRYLYLELPHQQLPLLIELEEYGFMEDYLQGYKRKPFYVYRRLPGSNLESIQVKEWDPNSYPDWCKTLK